MPSLKVKKNGAWQTVGTQPAVDETLTLPGVAADAKIVGEKFTQQQDTIESVLHESKSYTDTKISALANTAQENLDLFYSAIIRRKANPKTPLDIITYEGGQNQPTHPKVLYFHDGWGGHRYWMVYTPYPDNNNFYENPCITYSDDGITWSEEGILNPIIASTVNGCWYSDPHLVYIPGTNTMELWVRYCSNGSDGMANGWEGVYRMKSTDGINWSEKEYLHHVIDTEWASILSPSIIYDDGKYKIWSVYKRECLKYYESADGTNWKYVRNISINLTPLGSYKLWHFDMIKTNKGYEFVGCYQINGEFDKNNYIAYSWSADNKNFEPAVCVLDNGASGQFDDLELYRPCLVQIGNKYRIYYGAQKNIKIWHIGVVEAPKMDLLNELLTTNTTVALPSYTGVSTKFDAEIVNSFGESPWLTGYYNDNGIVTIDDSLDMHCSQPTSIGNTPKVIGTTASVKYLRASYFDKDNTYVGYDRGEGINTGNTGYATGYTVTVHPDIATYYTVSANTNDKSIITITDLQAERLELNGTLKVNYYINWITGECLAREDNFSAAYQDYIPVSPGEVYYIYAPYKAAKVTSQCVFYDENKIYNFDGDVTSDNRGTYAISDIVQGAEIVVPNGCAYMRFHVGAENLDMAGATVNDIFVYRKSD